MASEWTVVLRFDDRDIPNEDDFRSTVESDWCCEVIGDIETEEY